jgi:charged multivesicular body protein 4
MNLFANLNIFGKKKETSNPSVMDTIQKLKEQVIILNKRNNCVEQKIAAIMTEIKEVAKTNQQKALLLLDKKKTYDEEIHKNDCASILLEKQIASLETSVINKQVTDTLRNGNIFVKKFQQTMNIDNIEDLMDDIKETADTQKTISEIFSNQVQNIYDDEDLLNELNRITNEEEVKQEPELKQPQYNFPNVPMNHEDEQELVLLQQSLLL